MFGILGGVYSFTTTVNTSRTTSYTTSWTTSWTENTFFPFVADRTLWQDYRTGSGPQYIEALINGTQVWPRLEAPGGSNVTSYTYKGSVYLRKTLRNTINDSMFNRVTRQYDFSRDTPKSQTTSKTTTITTSFTTSFEDDFYA